MSNLEGFYFFIVMKVTPSIFLFLLLFLISCNQSDFAKENTTSVTERISFFIEESERQEHSFTDKKKLLDSAIVLSKSIENDSLLLKSLSHKAFIYFYYSPDSSKVSIQELENTASEKNSQKHKAYSATLYGNYYYKKTEYDSAYTYFKKSNFWYEKQDNIRVAYNLIMMARIHQFYNDYSGSEELVTQALDYIKHTDNTDYLIEIYNILGHSYLNIGDCEQAIEFYDRAIDLIPQRDNKVIVENNKAVAYICLKKYDEAKKILYHLLEQEDIGQDSEELAFVFYNIGRLKNEIDQEDGLEELQNSLDIRQRTNNRIGTIESHIKLAEYFEDKNKGIAKQHLYKAIDFAIECKNIDNHLEALKIITRLCDQDELSNYSATYIRLSDSITEVRQRAKNQFSKIRFDYSKETEQNLMLKTQTAEDELLIQKQKNTNLFLIFGLLFTATLSVFLYFIIKSRYKREKIKESYRTENRIAVKIHDELANDVYNTIAYIENIDLSEEANKLRLLDNLEDLYNRTRNISKENSTIDTEEGYVETLKNMFSEYQNEELKIVLQGIDDIGWGKIQSYKKMITYRVLQELMVNMKKHSQASVVMIRFENKDKQGYIYYSDNGVGMGEEKIIFKNGLQNVENRIKTINGTITFDSKIGRGLKVVLTFPL